MELIITELVSLIIVSTILLEHRFSHRSTQWPSGNTIAPVAITFLVYLCASILTHLSMRGYLRMSEGITITLNMVHLVAMPLYILYWMRAIERRLLDEPMARILERIQFAVLGLVTLVSFVDLAYRRFFQYNQVGRYLHGDGLVYLQYLCLGFIFIELVVLCLRWRRVAAYIRLLFLFSSLFLAISLIFFMIFRQPYLLGISSTFMLLFSYLVWQRRELTLDMLTRIPNYAAYLEQLKTIVITNRKATILVIDIENFRMINDRYGNAAGDSFLKLFAASLSKVDVRCSIFRLFGNRFALVLPRLSHNEIVRIVRAAKGIAAQGFLIEGSQVSCHINIAIVETPLKTNTIEEITDSLEFTMAEMKEKRRLSVIIFNQKLIPLRQRKLDILSVIRKAVIDESVVKVLYQPIIDTQGNHIIAAEALMRIVDERLGFVSPAEFIPAAEMAGLISSLTEIIIRKVCKMLAEHPKYADNLSHISVNVSASDLNSPDFASRVIAILKETGVNPKKLNLEVTESMFLTASNTVQENWDTLAGIGINFLLDDFGVGYSNLQSLVSKPFPIVKLDRSVVSNEENNFELLGLIAEMLNHLGKQMVAEGIENQRQLDTVRSYGIQYVQGYYFSKPVEEKQFLKMMTGSMCIIPSEKK